MPGVPKFPSNHSDHTCVEHMSYSEEQTHPLPSMVDRSKRGPTSAPTCTSCCNASQQPNDALTAAIGLRQHPREGAVTCRERASRWEATCPPTHTCPFYLSPVCMSGQLEPESELFRPQLPLFTRLKSVNEAAWPLEKLGNMQGSMPGSPSGTMQ